VPLLPQAATIGMEKHSLTLFFDYSFYFRVLEEFRLAISGFGFEYDTFDTLDYGI